MAGGPGARARARARAASRPRSGAGAPKGRNGAAAPGTRRTPLCRPLGWSRDPPANREARRSAVKGMGRGGGEAWEGRAFRGSAAGRRGGQEGLPGMGLGLPVERSPLGTRLPGRARPKEGGL